ncbi:hypothetical protein GGX14DRAFT_381389, partial [Mycena pura]
IQDPPTIGRKGRPLTQRLTGATEGRSQGGGARIQGPNASQASQRRPARCSKCHQPGHKAPTCLQGSAQ